MPKKIPDLKERLLSCARNVLIERKNPDLTIRSVASACGVATGTVYNYFSSKENLIESVIQADWAVMLGTLGRELGDATDAMTGLEIIARDLERFSERYYDVLQIPPTRLHWNDAFRSRHQFFADSLCAHIQPLLERFNCLTHPVLPLFLAEALLVLATDSDKHFENVRPIFEKLLI